MVRPATDLAGRTSFLIAVGVLMLIVMWSVVWRVVTGIRKTDGIPALVLLSSATHHTPTDSGRRQSERIWKTLRPKLNYRCAGRVFIAAWLFNYVQAFAKERFNL